MKKIRVWDLPVRLFHWALVALVLGAVITQKIGGQAMAWHFRCGYAVLALVLFRVVWGLCGTLYARFSNFIYAPSVIATYLKGGGKPHVGHNPVGGLAVIGFLAILLMQALSGLFSNDANESAGPFANWVGPQWSDKFTWFHQDVSAVLLYVFIALHVIAVGYYYFRKNNLISPMITGDKRTFPDALPADDSAATRWLALLILAICGLAVYLLVRAGA